jgi:hypothetical protein
MGWVSNHGRDKAYFPVSGLLCDWCDGKKFKYSFSLCVSCVSKALESAKSISHKKMATAIETAGGPAGPKRKGPWQE